YVHPPSSSIHATMLIQLIHFHSSFASGVNVSLFTNPILELGGSDAVGNQTRMFFIPLDLGSIAGSPISAAILTALGGFKALRYAGELLVL
ncbi:hypothetical protein BKA70DRAFT_1086902, partial [Coprinopsis sp. MPI-PUGE-AT-0042]